MKKIILGVLAITALAGACSFSAQAQAPANAPALTADQIVNKHLEALGGRDAISKVKSMTTEASMQVMGQDAPSTTVVVDGVGMRQESEFNGMKIISAYTDKSGWMVNPMAGAADPTPMPADQYNAGKIGIWVGGPLFDYAAKGSTVELTSKDDKTYTLKLTTKDKVEYTFGIDAKTFYLNTMTATAQMQGQAVTLTTTYSDYRKTDTGFMVPYNIGLDFGGQFQISMTIKKIEINKTIDPAIFAMPKA
jgi:hypothetical protein